MVAQHSVPYEKMLVTFLSANNYFNLHDQTRVFENTIRRSTQETISNFNCLYTFHTSNNNKKEGDPKKN